jgi:hypothetical protein
MTSILIRAAAAANAIIAALLLSSFAHATVIPSTVVMAAVASAITTNEDYESRADADRSGMVDVNDILIVIDEYGDDCEATPCRADTNLDGEVSMFDLLQVLAHYGAVIPANVDGDVQTLLSGTYLCEQSRYADDVSSLEEAGVKNDCWMLHGYAVVAPNDITVEEFFAATEEDIRAKLLAYLSDKVELDPETTDYVILDIEHPVHPRTFGGYLNPSHDLYDPAQFARIIDAFTLRISVARELFPNAQLGLFGVTTPHPFGNAAIEAQITRQSGFLAASAAGLYDDLDVLCPVIYQRFGRSDARHYSIEPYTQLGIDSAGLLRRSDGTTPSIMPVMSLAIFNGGSADHEQPILVEDLAAQIGVLQERGYTKWLVWNDDDTVSDTDLLVTDYFDNLLSWMQGDLSEDF